MSVVVLKGVGLGIVYVLVLFAAIALWLAGLVGGGFAIAAVLGDEGLIPCLTVVAWGAAYVIGTGFGAYDLAERL